MSKISDCDRVLRNNLRCKKKSSEITSFIKENCLYDEECGLGTRVIDYDKVYNLLVCEDETVREIAKKKGIKSGLGLESYIDEVTYEVTHEVAESSYKSSYKRFQDEIANLGWDEMRDAITGTGLNPKDIC